MESKDTINTGNEIEKSNQIKSKNKFMNLKSDFFLSKLFDIMQTKLSLKIIKYNNAMQKRLNINIKNYKEYSETYTPIELEIIPGEKKFDKFININEGEEDFFHIYFNNKKKEVKRANLFEFDLVSKIKIIIDYQVLSFNELFYFCTCIESITFKKFYRNNINNMSYMFHGCSLLKEINLSKFNTNNVTDMNYMFYGCSSLKELDLSNFNTNNVTDMCCMFAGCSSLKELNISNFIINNKTDVTKMFDECSDELKKKIKMQNKNFDDIFN